MTWYGCYPQEEHTARVMVGDKPALAWEWIKAYAANLTDQCNGEGRDEVTPEELIETANSHQDGSWGDYITRGGAFEGESVESTFWDKYAEFTGRDRDSIEENSFFSCSC